jgi:acyl-CoA dehydrogenase
LAVVLEAATLIVLLAALYAAAMCRAPQWVWALGFVAVAAVLQLGIFQGRVGVLTFGPFSLICWLLAAVLTTLCVPSVRRKLVVTPAFHMLRRAMPRLSDRARQMLGGGTVGYEAEFFGGKPSWSKLCEVAPITLTVEEKEFLERATNQLCAMIDDWYIRHNREIPENIWRFLRTAGFFGLRIPKAYGGLGFSPQALSLVLGKIASRSPDVFILVMIPNSLGLGELIETYGTEDQKRRYLPPLASGDDIPCLALTGPASGSDAATMQDIGTIVRDGGALCIRISWDKRYITLAPNATLIGLAFHLFDPDNLLGRGEDIGITVAIIPAKHPGVNIGRCHLAGGAFPVGPTSGKDVVIPLAWIIGGEAMAGQGWGMLMESVSASRAISLPACATAGIKSMLRRSTAYGLIRRQFGAPIARMEGLEEPLARMIEAAYVAEAGRAITAAMVARGERPAIISALMKYQTVERLRRCVNDAMDLHGGRAVCDGLSNYLQATYQMVPAAVTVEGANIITRVLIAFTQGALRAHPHLQAEFDACQETELGRGLAAFEPAFLSHIAFTLSNLSAALFHNITGGLFCKTPEGVGMGRWHRQLQRASRSFAVVTDLTLLLMGGALATRQKLTGRLSDALSELYLLACALKRYADNAAPANDHLIVEFVARNGLYRFRTALRGAIDNFPVAWARFLMKLVVFPLGFQCSPASDRLGHKIVRLVLDSHDVRDRLTQDIYVSKDAGDPTGLLEVVFEKVSGAEDANKRLDRAIRRGLVRRYHGTDWISNAVKQNVISEREAGILREIEVLTARVIAVDDFDPDEVKPNYMTAGHNIKMARATAPWRVPSLDGS